MAQSTSPSKPTPNNCQFDTLPSSLLLQISSYNVTHKDLTALKRVNKSFYDMLNPNAPIVNKLWETVTRTRYPLIPQRLKCKRWDLYYQYRFGVIQHANRCNDEHQEMRELVDDDEEVPFVNVIENCDYDMNAINEQYQERITRKTSEHGDLKEDEIFKGEIGSNGLPKGFNKKLKCPMVVAGNTDFLDYVELGIYSCRHCKKKVHTVTTLQELKDRVQQKKCVRIVYYPDLLNKSISEEMMGDVVPYDMFV